MNHIFSKISYTILTLITLSSMNVNGIIPESKLAHALLDELSGLEIGGAAHNPFGLNTLNVDYTDDYTTIFKQEEVRLAGYYLKVDIVANGDDLPIPDNSVDFVISSHVIEHFYDPIKAIKEWFRVTKPGGFIYIIAPHKERTFDKDRPRTTLTELIERQQNPISPEDDDHRHYSVWMTKDFLEFCKYYRFIVVGYQNIDDKVGNGFTIILQKPLKKTDQTKNAIKQARKKIQNLAKINIPIPKKPYP